MMPRTFFWILVILIILILAWLFLRSSRAELHLIEQSPSTPTLPVLY
jgi:Tfp pilus assembly protein PilO